MGEQVQTVTLGLVTLVGVRNGPCIDVGIDGTQAPISMTLQEWSSLLAISDVLAATGKLASELSEARESSGFWGRATARVQMERNTLRDALRSILSTPAFGQSAACEMHRLAAEALIKVGGE
jgi:hypothetical protein